MPMAGGLGGLPGPQMGLGALASQAAPMGSPMAPAAMPSMPPMGPPMPQGGLGALGSPPGVMDRPPGMAAGGPMSSVPFFVRSEARSLGHTGPVIGSTLGRSDSRSLSVPGGSYVLPSSHVAALGGGNSLAGMSLLGRMFSSGPYGAAVSKGGRGMGLPKAPRAGGAGGFAGGGSPPEKNVAVPIRISDGEFVVPPHIVEIIGGGDIEKGHKVLDHWVMETRKKHIKELAKLPKPAK